MNTAPIVEFDAVSKRFADRSVLNDVSFNIERGETLGLVGVNGAGKTTLIRGLLDLNRMDAGLIRIDGVVNTDTASRAQLTYLAERFAPPSFATGFEVLAYLQSLHGQRFDRARAADEARRLDLDPAALSRPAREYSKGMAQKLGLMACILPGPPLLVLDEPMSGLDPRARALFRRRLEQLKADGTTLFFSTHLLADVESICDRIVVLHGGVVAFDGTPAALAGRSAEGSLEAAFLELTAQPGPN